MKKLAIHCIDCNNPQYNFVRVPDFEEDKEFGYVRQGCPVDELHGGSSCRDRNKIK